MLEEIKPCKVMRYFEEISKIPRKSGKEDITLITIEI